MTSEIRSDSALSRRHFLGASLLAGGSLLLDLRALATLPPHDDISEPFPGGKLVTILPFTGEAKMQFGKLSDSGLDGRLYTDLSELSPESLITPVDRFYVRTSCPDLIDYSSPWLVKVVGSSERTMDVTIQRIESMSKDMGIHLMECSGNERAGQFGLISACSWTGVPVMHLLKSLKMMPHHQRICISGFDRHSKPSGTPGLRKSIPGASWVFTPEQLEATGAFLATKMNGETLPNDHGRPLRLFVPGWYGCACIKWVNEITFVNENAPATSQMQEFADRTHQDGTPQLAREYKPASMDQAAMAIRVEQWEVDEHTKYNVVGIMWGGYKLTTSLEIQFAPDEPFVPVENYHQTTNATWTLWSHRWSPKSPGNYHIRLRIGDNYVPTRRLDKGYYTRAVKITDVAT